jgi:hypothetical protein
VLLVLQLIRVLPEVQAIISEAVLQHHQVAAQEPAPLVHPEAALAEVPQVQAEGLKHQQVLLIIQVPEGLILTEVEVVIQPHQVIIVQVPRREAQEVTQCLHEAVLKAVAQVLTIVHLQEGLLTAADHLIWALQGHIHPDHQDHPDIQDLQDLQVHQVLLQVHHHHQVPPEVPHQEEDRLIN